MRFVHIAVTIVTFLIVCAGALGLYGVNYISKPNAFSENVLVEIPAGWGMNRLAFHLEQETLIDHAAPFKLLARLNGKSDKLRSGEFLITANSSILDILEQLTEGVGHQRQVTFPEGATSYEIVRALNQNESFVGELIRSLPVEGSLLPETYNFTKGETRQQVLNRMAKAQQSILDVLWESRAIELPFTSKQDALTLASIIEKETGVGGERRRISGVFVNRLRIGMLLQTDPTVIYAITKGKHENNGKGPLGRRLYRKDLNVDSPYNTYRFKGLPPTPIANPGKAAIEAALNPDTHDYIYFVADGTGGHVFSKTLDEHNRNAAKWRKIRKTLGQ